MKKPLGKKFWASMLIFGLAGQVAWTVENMYFNVFIYKMFHASAAQISLMVGASSVAATVTTILIGALSDRIGKRKILICGGYLLWGITILSFALIRVDVLTPLVGSIAAACSLGINLVIIMDCIMTFFGSAANDAAYNAWLTDKGNDSNRGKIEGFNSMMPLVSILVVFGGFMGFNLDLAESWTAIFLIIGIVVIVIGILGFFIIEETQKDVVSQKDSYWATVLYSFRPSVLLNNKLLYAVLGAFALFGISIQTFMPYLILYYEKSLEMTNYVLIMAPAIIIAAVITALYGRVYDMQGFKGSIIPVCVELLSGYVILYFTKTTVPVFIGSLLMMTGYMTGMAIFGAMIRDNIPENRAGQFQGIRIIGQVLIPGIIGPAIGAYVLRNAELIVNSDGTTSFLPNKNIWLAAIVTGIILCIGLELIFTMMRRGHHELWSEAGKKVRDGKKTWDKYPRPQMKREKWMSLNGEWELNESSIQIPFPPQSMLSRFKGTIGSALFYEKKFTVPNDFINSRILLHFGAVDQEAEVWINDTYMGEHLGGYLPFSFDITEAVNRNGENRLRVLAMDTLSHKYPYGKQRKNRGGMWYTPVSGIWQSVWIENVPETYIENVKITPDLTGVDLEVFSVSNKNSKEETYNASGDNAKKKNKTQNIVPTEVKAFSVAVTVPNSQGKEETLKFAFVGNKGRIELPNPILWTPDNPYLYQMTITMGDDTVESYFALRTISIEKDEKGISRVCLNKEPIFLHGILEQGYFSDGLYLPAEEEEYDREVLRMKELGFNMLRKHIKVEPEYFYYACDRLGMLVMQDMVNNGPYHFIGDTALPTFGFKKKNDAKGGMNSSRKQFFIKHMEETIAHVYNHPSIVAYTIFNEGWGQFHSDVMYDKVKGLDSTRLVDSTSGWFAQSKNDFDSEHIYFKVISLTPKSRPLFVTECGGYAMVAEGHYYSKYSSYGYGVCKESHALTEQIKNMYRNMILPSIPDGLCGCIYTQVSDVEDEVNGLYTYDRAVCKVEKETMVELAREMKEAVQ